MAVEAARGCGHRKVGGLYLVGAYKGVPCCRLPAPLGTCPTCSEGIKFSRAIKWVKAALIFKEPAKCISGEVGGSIAASVVLETRLKNGLAPACPMAAIETFDDKHALMWVGEAHYPMPEDFEREADVQGVSKRIAQLPRGLVLGKTRVFLAHNKAVPCDKCKGAEPAGETCDCREGFNPGVFMSFVPQRVERVVTETMKRIAEQWADIEKTQPDLDREQVISKVLDAVQGPGIDWQTIEGYEWVKSDLQRGITLVAVPDDDQDHLRPEKAKRAKVPTRPSRNGKMPKPLAEVETADQAKLEVE